ncbi:MAG TPA: MBL fold metallo-hydrolase [Terriglobia bacterium]|nr:MBL fold metallo-hydrolase [Terriglobia bacterium]
MLTHHWKAEALLEGDWRGASCVLLTNGCEPLLVDTGMPHDAHRLLAALAQRGFEPSDIRIIINTHFHLDHVSNNCLFPRSAIYATQESYDWCHALYADLVDAVNWKTRVLKYYPEMGEYPEIEHLMDGVRRVALRWWDSSRSGLASQFRWIERHALPDGIAAVVTHGHVPGHVSLLTQDSDGTTVVAGDALLTRTHDDQVLTMIPRWRAEYLAGRQKILSIAGRIIPGHDRAFINVPADEPSAVPLGKPAKL